MKRVKRPTKGGCFEHNMTIFEWKMAWDRAKDPVYGICICCYGPCEYTKKMRCRMCLY